MLPCHHFHHGMPFLLRLTNEVNGNHDLLSHVLWVFKYYIYMLKVKYRLNIDILFTKLMKSKERQKRINLVSSNKSEVYNKN